MLAAYCNDTQNLGSYLFYAKFHGSYSHNDQAGGNANMLVSTSDLVRGRNLTRFASSVHAHSAHSSAIRGVYLH